MTPPLSGVIDPADAKACLSCGRILTSDERGLTRKLVNRGATKFFCLTCLSRRFAVSEDTLREKIEAFRAAGCALFL